MATTLSEGFNVFHGRLTPTTGESSAAASHRKSIKECLERNFSMRRFFRSGSFGNGTSIRGYSDVDYFAELPTSELTQSSTATLKKVCAALDARFPNSGVKVSTPAVVVPFGIDASEATEVVPADFVAESQGYRVYDIADMSGGWMRSSPDAHTAYVRAVDSKHNGQVKPLIRFVKAWKCFKNVPILSFYLELYVAKYANGQNNILYYWDLYYILKQLWDGQLSAIQDPMGISGYVYPCSSAPKKEDALSKLVTAYVRAQKAFEAQRASNTKDAVYRQI